MRGLLHLRWWIVGAVVLCAGAVFAAREWSTDPPAKVTATTLTRGDMESSVSTSGLVVPVDDFLARATNGGTVQRVLVKLGDHVSAGQLLVVMKDPYAESRVASAEAALRASQVGLENTRRGGSPEDRINFTADRERLQQERSSAERNLDTMTRLLQSGGASQAEVTAARQRLDGANVNLRAAEQRLSQRYAPSENASWSAKVHEEREIVRAERANLGNVQIVSAISGTAYLVPANNNDFVGPGAELVRVADLTKLQVRADFDEQDMGKLRAGEPVLLRWEGRPERVWHGHIERAPLAFTHNGTRRVGQSIISVEDATGDLPPDSTVTVTTRVDQRHAVPMLPREALHIEDGQHVVYRVVHGTLVRTPVRTGLITLDRVEVLEGLGPGDQVALHRLDHQELTEHARVEIVPSP